MTEAVLSAEFRGPLDCAACGGYDLRDGAYIVRKHKPNCDTCALPGPPGGPSPQSAPVAVCATCGREFWTWRGWAAHRH